MNNENVLIGTPSYESSQGNFYTSPYHGDAQFQTRGTSSFVTIHSEVTTCIDAQVENYEHSQATAVQRIARPTTPTIGQLQPIGDAIVPCMIMALVYVTILLIRKKVCKQ